MPVVESSGFDMAMVPVVIKMPSFVIPVDLSVFDIWMLPSLVMVPPKKELKIPIFLSPEFDKIMFPEFRLVNSPSLLKLTPWGAAVDIVNVPPLVKLSRLSN